jgi:hypothetical protein
MLECATCCLSFDPQGRIDVAIRLSSIQLPNGRILLKLKIKIT